LHGRQVFGRPMRIEYALSKSNVVAQSDGTFRLDQPHKHMSAAQRKQQLGIAAGAGDGPEKRRQSADGAGSDEPAAKRRVTAHGGDGQGSPAYGSSDNGSDDDDDDDDNIGPAAPPQAAAADVSPNSTLFVTSLPADIADEQLVSLFQQYVGFKEVRRIPGRGDMAFVDYATTDAAAAARSVLDGFKVLDGQAMSIAFSR
ncbi:U2 small nuclear ribonucleoprotein B'', partial [Coemansia helicoidea]